MSSRLSRRALLRRALVGGTALGMGQTSLAASNRRAGVPPSESRRGATARTSHVEPLVRLLEATPRDQVLVAVGEKILEGAGYLDVLAALLLAGVREVQPRPTVGYKFHTVLAVISYHLIGNGLSERDRWLPVFWGIDYFKVALHISQKWRGRYLACGAMHFVGPDERDNAVVRRTQMALGR